MTHLLKYALLLIACTACGISSSIPVKQVYPIIQTSKVYDPHQIIDCIPSSAGANYGSIEVDTVKKTLVVVPPHYDEGKVLPIKIRDIKLAKNDLAESLNETAQLPIGNSTIRIALTSYEGTDVDRGKTTIIVSTARSSSSGKIMGMAITLMGSPGAGFYCTRYTINPVRLPNNLGVLFSSTTTSALETLQQRPTRTKFYPMDDKPQITDPRQLAFIEELKEILRNRDTEKIKTLYGEYSSDISETCPTSDSYDSATEGYVCAFRSSNSKEWNEILSLVETGCSTEGIFPWYENAIEKYIGEEKVKGREFVIEDGFTPDYKAGAVSGNNINIRSEPSANTTIIGTISKEAVCVDEDYRDDQWVKITTLDKKTTGYVSSKYMFTPNSVRLIIDKELYQYQYNGKRMTEWAVSQHIAEATETSRSDVSQSQRDRYLLPHSEWSSEWKIHSFRGWD